MLSHGVSLLHSSLTSRKNIEARMPMRLSEVVQVRACVNLQPALLAD